LLGVKRLSKLVSSPALLLSNIADQTENPLPADQPLNPQDGAGAGNPEGDKYVISIKQVAKFVVGLGDRVAPTDVEEGMRVG
jgi:26S proteasome regulatory subunit T1